MLRYRSSVAILGLLVSACLGQAEQKTLAYCETAVMDQLKSPSTYKRINLTDTSFAKGVYEYWIEFDAANSYGTPIRGMAFCKISSGVHLSNLRLDEMRMNGISLSSEKLKFLNSYLPRRLD